MTDIPTNPSMSNLDNYHRQDEYFCCTYMVDKSKPCDCGFSDALSCLLVAERIKQLEWTIGTIKHNSYEDFIYLVELKLTVLQSQLTDGGSV